MNKNKQVLKHCPNFYKIINFDYFEEDDLSEKLIDIYHRFVFMVDVSDSKQVKRLEELDLIFNRLKTKYSPQKINDGNDGDNVAFKNCEITQRMNRKYRVKEKIASSEDIA